MWVKDSDLLKVDHDFDQCCCEELGLVLFRVRETVASREKII